jgi:hypothetical protein
MKRSGIFVSCLVVGGLSIVGCSTTPAPQSTQPIATTSSNSTITNPLVGSVNPSPGSTAAPTTTITIGFTQALTPANIERAFDLVPGGFNADPGSFPTKLTLTAMCNGRWRVRNTNSGTVVFTWDVYQGTEKGSGLVPANADVFFTTSTGQKTVRVFVGSVQQSVKAANTTTCSSPDVPRTPGRVAGSFAWNGAAGFTFTPSGALAGNTTYTVFLGLNAPYASTFTTTSTTGEVELDPSLIDPSLPTSERESFVTVLNQLAPDARAAVSYVGSDGKLYGSSPQARAETERLAMVENNVFRSGDGHLIAFPGDAEETNGGTGALRTMANQSTPPTWQQLARCDPSGRGVGASSGPYRRITAPSGTETAKANWVRVAVYLPTGETPENPDTAEAGGFIEPVTYSGQNLYLHNGPFLYLGGWGDSGEIAVDAGFQLSTGLAPTNGKPARPANGYWTAFIKGGDLAGTKFALTGQLSDSPGGKFLGGQTVLVTFWNLDNLLILAVNGKTKDSPQQTRTRVLAVKTTPKPGSLGWRGDGLGNTYKLMTSIAQGVPGAQVQLPGGTLSSYQSLPAQGYLRNAWWSTARIGYVAGKAPKLVDGKWFVSGPTQFEGYTIQPSQNAPESERARNFFSSPSIACEFPNNYDPASSVVPVLDSSNKWNRTIVQSWLIYRHMVQVGPNDNQGGYPNNPFECVSIDMRQPSSMIAVVNGPFAVPGTPWPYQEFIPPPPNCNPNVPVVRASASQRSAVARLSSLGTNQPERVKYIDLFGQPGQTVTQLIRLANIRGTFNSQTRYTIFPLGYPVMGGNAIEGFTAPSSLSSLEPIVPIPVDQRFGPWTSDLYDITSSFKPLRYEPYGPNTIVFGGPPLVYGDSWKDLTVSAACPNYTPGNPYMNGYTHESFIDVIYSTGVVDNGGTPNDLSDDVEGRDGLRLVLRLTCKGDNTALYVTNSLPNQTLNLAAGETYTGTLRLFPVASNIAPNTTTTNYNVVLSRTETNNDAGAPANWISLQNQSGVVPYWANADVNFTVSCPSQLTDPVTYYAETIASAAGQAFRGSLITLNCNL